MTPKLENLRDELAIKDLKATYDRARFCEGFDACHDTLMPVIEELMSALEQMRHSAICDRCLGNLELNENALGRGRELIFRASSTRSGSRIILTE